MFTTVPFPFAFRSLSKSADGKPPPCQIQGNTLLAVARIANAPLTFYTRAEYLPHAVSIRGFISS